MAAVKNLERNCRNSSYSGCTKCLGALENVSFFLLFLIVYFFPLVFSFFIISNHLSLLERQSNCQQKSVALSSLLYISYC
uniref:Uncharacterized protein n=1 Tax=Nelumbo nucifera TaxID=4432 RepID=A0A822ZBE5_NELNU|nr:TPA_asm: hypothetical protein HUJ06_015092 [Nelumbo nucifera]